MLYVPSLARHASAHCSGRPMTSASSIQSPDGAVHRVGSPVGELPHDDPLAATTGADHLQHVTGDDRVHRGISRQVPSRGDDDDAVIAHDLDTAGAGEPALAVVVNTDL